MSHKLTLLPLLIALCLCFLGCSSQESEPLAKAPSPTPSARSNPSVSSRPEKSETDENTDQEDEDTAENSDDEDSEAGYFHGHRCTIDCSGHKAGYEWAEQHDIHDPDNCGGNSESFIEGCKIYAEEVGSALTVPVRSRVPSNVAKPSLTKNAAGAT